MNDVFYYKSATSGRTIFTTFKKVGAYEWSNEGMSVKRQSIDDLKSVDDLIGTKVHLDDCEGIIIGCCPIDKPLTGKYIGDNKYLSHKGYLNMNNLVQVHWTKGHNTTWQPFHKLIIKT